MRVWYSICLSRGGGRREGLAARQADRQPLLPYNINPCCINTLATMNAIAINTLVSHDQHSHHDNFILVSFIVFSFVKCMHLGEVLLVGESLPIDGTGAAHLGIMGTRIETG